MTRATAKAAWFAGHPIATNKLEECEMEGCWLKSRYIVTFADPTDVRAFCTEHTREYVEMLYTSSVLECGTYRKVNPLTLMSPAALKQRRQLHRKLHHALWGKRPA